MPKFAILSKTLRSGSFVTDEVSIPANVKGFVSVAFDILETDLRNPALTAALKVETSSDNGATWQFLFGMTWQGNSALRNGLLVGQPAVTIGTDALWLVAGERIRAWVMLSEPFTTGIVLERG